MKKQEYKILVNGAAGKMGRAMGGGIAQEADMRIVAAELDYLMYEPFKEFITMAFLLVGNIPLLYFLNKDWYNVLVNTGFGKGILAVCLLVLLISFAAVIRLTKPVEYKR